MSGGSAGFPGSKGFDKRNLEVAYSRRESHADNPKKISGSLTYVLF